MLKRLTPNASGVILLDSEVAKGHNLPRAQLPPPGQLFSETSTPCIRQWHHRAGPRLTGWLHAQFGRPRSEDCCAQCGPGRCQVNHPLYFCCVLRRVDVLPRPNLGQPGSKSGQGFPGTVQASRSPPHTFFQTQGQAHVRFIGRYFAI